jgi:type I restriction enzyme S subunit
MGIDVLPDCWDIKQIGEVVTEAQPGFACGERDEMGTVQLRMNNVGTTGRFEWKDFVRVPVDQRQLSRYNLQSGDVLFNNTNSVELVGKSALFSGYKEPVVYSNHFTRIRTRPTLCDPEFFSFWLNHLWQSRIFSEICDRWIGQSAVKFDKLSKIEIPLPPLAEQQRIVAILKHKLAAVERARKASLARIDAARALSAAYLREIFDSEEAAEWTAFKLGDLALLVQNGLYKKDEFYGLGEPLIRMYNLDNESWRINQTKLARVTLEDDDKEKFRLKVGDLLVSRVNSYEQVGKSGIVSYKEDGAFFENMLIRLRFSSEVEPLFMANQFATQTFRKALRGLAKRAIGQASINSTDLRSQIVRLPGISRQREICRMLSMRQSSIEFLRNSLTEEHSALDAMPAAFLRRAFSGNL